MTHYVDIVMDIKKMYSDKIKIIKLLENIKKNNSKDKMAIKTNGNKVFIDIFYKYWENFRDININFISHVRLAAIEISVIRIENYYIVNVNVRTDFNNNNYTCAVDEYHQDQDKVIIDFLHEHGLIKGEIMEKPKMSPKERLLYDIIKEGSVLSYYDGPYPINARLGSDEYHVKVYRGIIIAVIDKSTQVLSVLFYGNITNEEKKSKIDINVPEERKGLWLDLLEKKGIKV